MAKGSANERKVAKDFSLWWSDGKRDDLVWRSSGSGGRATNRSRQGKTTAASYGDLTSLDPIIDPLFRIVVVELKKGYTKDLDLLSLIDGKGTKYRILEFWEQVVRDSERSMDAGWGGNPLLIIHRDYKLPIIIMRKSFYNKLEEYFGEITNVKIRLDLDTEKLVLFRLLDFFNNVSPSFFIEKFSEKEGYLDKE